MNTHAPAMAATAWAQHLAAAPAAPTRLSPQEALRVQRYQERMLAALQTRDRCALRAARHAAGGAAQRLCSQDAPGLAPGLAAAGVAHGGLLAAAPRFI